MSRHARLGNRKIKLPNSRVLRIALGVLLILLGFLGFLPVLGFWMIPLGLLVLSVDLPFVRRLRRRLEVAFTRWWDARRGRQRRERGGRNGRKAEREGEREREREA